MIVLSGIEGLFLIIAGGILLWGFERYRTRFVKSDLLFALLLSGGVILFVVAPSTFDAIGSALNISYRYVVMSVLANITLLLLILYLITIVRNTRASLGELTRNLSIQETPQTDGGRDTIFVIIPAYNEEATIRTVVKSLPERIREYVVQPVVVSDGSVDQTVERARYNGAIVVEHPINQGQGGALKTGFEVAQQSGASIVVTMDADGQHPVEELENLVSPIIDDEADYVMGSRYKGVNRSGNGIVREVGIRFFTIVINILTKAEITDCTNGFRAIRGTVLTNLKLTEERFSAPELIIEARKNGLRITEIPITIKDRKEGETRKPKVGFAIGLARTIIATWLR